MDGHDVRPAKWSDVIDLYDDGEYSAIWGRYENAPCRVLGVRWNGHDGGKGFPLSSGHPVWHVEPDFLAKGILSALLEQSLSSSFVGGQTDNIVTAITELGFRYDRNKIHLAIALYAAGNRGKTATLKKLIEELKSAGAKVLEEKPVWDGSPDLLFACKYKGQTTGIATNGDDGDAIKRAFDFFDKYNCDIVFSGTRSRSDSYSCQAYYEVTRERNVRVMWVRKLEAEEKDWERVNSEQAKDLMAIIDRN